MLSSTCEQYCADVKVIERCCRCIRYAVRCLNKNSAVLLLPLVTQVSSVRHGHSPCKPVSLSGVVEMSAEVNCAPGLRPSCFVVSLRPLRLGVSVTCVPQSGRRPGRSQDASLPAPDELVISATQWNPLSIKETWCDQALIFLGFCSLNFYYVPKVHVNIRIYPVPQSR